MVGRRAGRGLRRRAARTRERRRGDGVGGDWVRAVSVVGGGRVGSARGVRRSRDVTHVDARPGLLPRRTSGKKRPSSLPRVGPRRAEGGSGSPGAIPRPRCVLRIERAPNPGHEDDPAARSRTRGSLGVARRATFLAGSSPSSPSKETRVSVTDREPGRPCAVYAGALGRGAGVDASDLAAEREWAAPGCGRRGGGEEGGRVEQGDRKRGPPT